MKEGKAIIFFEMQIFDKSYEVLSKILGLVIHPYKTMKEIIRQESFFGTFTFLGLLPFWALSLGVIRGGLKLGLFLGFLRFFKLSLGFLVAYIFTTMLMYFLGRLFGGKGSLRTVFAVWVYSYVPTFLWFGTVVLFYLLLPPPRTTSFWGYLFSVFFVAISLCFFWWKALLYYLTMRFCLKLTFWRILGVSMLFFPIGFLYSFWMYKIGIFRVPFV